MRPLWLLMILLIGVSIFTGCTNHDHVRLTGVLGPRVTVIVTVDGGETTLVRRNIGMTKSMTVMESLRQVADVRTLPNGTIQSINGMAGGNIRELGPEPSAWFYRVNGFEGGIEPDRYEVLPGDVIWWDLRRWDAYPVVPVAVGGFPHIVVSGYRGLIRETHITYDEGFRPQASEYEHLLRQISPIVRNIQYRGRTGDIPIIGSRREAGRTASFAVGTDVNNIVIGMWDSIRLDPFISDVAFNPRAFGLTVWIEGGQVRRQQVTEEKSMPLIEAEGVIWATTVDGEPDSAPMIIITGTTAAGVEAASQALLEGRLHRFYAAAVTADGKVIP